MKLRRESREPEARDIRDQAGASGVRLERAEATGAAKLEAVTLPHTLGHTVVNAHRCDGDLNREPKHILVAHNFVPQTDFAPVPDPMGDVYLSWLGVSALSPGESALSFPLPRGLEARYRQQGILDPSNQVFEFPMEAGEGGKLGFPYTDPIRAAIRSGFQAPEGSVLVTAFPSQGVTEDATQLGASTVQLSSTQFTSNKAAFHEAAEKYGFRTSDTLVLRSEEDLHRAISRFSSSHRVWVRSSSGSGGDLVHKVDGPVTEEKVREAISVLKREISTAFFHSDAGMKGLERFWPHTAIVPADGKVLISNDASHLGSGRGELLYSGSNSMVVSRDGSVQVTRDYKQLLSSDGDYLGSHPYLPEPELRERLHAQMEKVGRYCAEELKLFGLVGVDYVVVKNADGAEIPVLIELNGRPSISATADIIASKVGAEHWVNVNVWTDKPLSSMEEFDAVFGEYTQSDRGVGEIDVHAGYVVPQALRHITLSDGKEIASGAAKVLVCGSDMEHCHRIIADLAKNGVRFSAE